MASRLRPDLVAKLDPAVIGRAIDNLPFNPRMRFIMVLCMLGFLFDNFDNMLMSYALPAVTKEFQIDAATTGLIGSTGMIGMAVGSYVWGWIADHWGRLAVFATTVLVFSLFSGLSALTFSVGFLIGARFLTGFGIGGMIPVDITLMSEYSPARIRGRVAGTLPLVFPVGMLLAAGFGLWLVPTVGWRWLFVLGIVPALLVYFVRRQVPESPRWLAGRGRYEDAWKSLEYVGVDEPGLERAANEIAKEPAAPRMSTKTAISELFVPGMRLRVTHTWLSWACSNFAAWGFNMMVPTIFFTVYHIELVRTLQYTFIIAGAEILGRIMCYLLIDRIGRKPTIIYAFVIAGAAAYAFNFAKDETSLVITACCFIAFCAQTGFALTVYTPEVYPLRVRAMGMASSQGLGRVAGILGPLTAGFFLSPSGIGVVWTAFSVSLLLGAVLTIFLGKETMGKNLEKTGEVPSVGGEEAGQPRLA